MHRWSVCAGSIALSKGVERPSSEYAEEGSDAHALAAHCLSPGAQDADACVFEGTTATFDGRKFFVSEDMVEAVQVYLDYVRGLAGKNDRLYVEHRFDLSNVHPGLYGTADAVIWQPRTKTLVVVDYKHGAGIPVEVKDNPQLLYYGLGALMNLGHPAKQVQIVVVQPRVNHPDGAVRTQLVPVNEMLDFTMDLVGYARATEDPKAPLHAGDHCRFCPANTIGPDGKPLCPEIKNASEALAMSEFKDLTAANDNTPPASYNPEKLALALDSLPVLESYIKNVREFAYAEAEAGRFGNPGDGYKLVAKRATRKWRSEGEVVDFCQAMDLGGDDLFKPRALKSPAQLEKVVGKGTLDGFITAESSGHTLVHESDKRPPVRIDPAHEFKAIAS